MWFYCLWVGKKKKKREREAENMNVDPHKRSLRQGHNMQMVESSAFFIGFFLFKLLYDHTLNNKEVNKVDL